MADAKENQSGNSPKQTRRAPHSAWKPGQSGNPAGRPKGFAGLASAIAKHTRDGEELVEFALSVLRGEVNNGEEPSTRDRLEALKWLAVRGFGQPVQPVELTGKDGGPIATKQVRANLSNLSDEELEAIDAVYRRAYQRAVGDGASGAGSAEAG